MWSSKSTRSCKQHNPRKAYHNIGERLPWKKAKFVCGTCYGKLKTKSTGKYLNYKISLDCKVCDKEFIDSRVGDTPITNAFVYSTLDIGLGYRGYHSLTGNMTWKHFSVSTGIYRQKIVMPLQRKWRKYWTIVLKLWRHIILQRMAFMNVRVIHDGS